MKGPAALALCLLAAPPARSADRFAQPIVLSLPGMDRVGAARDLTYRTVDGAELKMDVYVPPPHTTAGLRPVVFFVHGGPIAPDMKPKDWGVFRSYGALAAVSGFVAVTFNHRLFAAEDYGRAWEDVTAAVEFVRGASTRFQADPDRTALWVFSGGGPFLGPALRQPPSHLAALVSYYGLLDPRGSRDAKGTPMAEDLARRFSPVEALESGSGPFPPVLIARAGKDDPSINTSVEAFARAAWAKGVVLDVLNHPDGQHGFDVLNDEDRSREVIRRTLDFLRARLGV
jgi:acetyl esterase/lipase